MQVDRQELSDYYGSLSDEELLELDRAELTEVAQKFYDSELEKRHLSADDTEASVEPTGSAAPVDVADGADDEDGAIVIDLDEGAEPDWLESAYCAVAYRALPGGSLPRMMPATLTTRWSPPGFHAISLLRPLTRMTRNRNIITA